MVPADSLQRYLAEIRRIPLLSREEEQAIDRAIVEGYTRIPSTPEEDAWAEWSARRSVAEEPW